MIPHDRRSTPRLEAGHLVIHTDPDGEEGGDCLGLAVTLDLNEFGLRFQTTERLKVGTRYRLGIALEDQVVNAVGRIVHVSRALNDTFEAGVEFLDVAPRDVERIRRYAVSRDSG